MLSLTGPLPGEYLGQRHGSVKPAVHAHVELSGNRLEPPVAVAVQINHALSHAIPRPEGIMAKHEMYPVTVDLRVVRDTRPTPRAYGPRAVVVTNDQMLPS